MDGEEVTEDLAALFELMPIGLASVALSDGRITAGNAVFRKLFAIPNGHPLGMSILDFYPKEDLDVVRKWYADARLQKPQLVQISRRYVNFEGKPFEGFAYAWLTAGPDGTCDKLVGAFFDMNEGARSQFVRAAERRSERQARAELARETANELNNALTQLTTSLESLVGSDQEVPSGVRGAIARTMSVARKLLVLGWGTSPKHSNGATESGAPVQSAAAEYETALKTGPLRILVVEDNDDLREQIVASLRAFGHLATGAADGKSAVVLLDEIDANRALIDLRLELESGRDVADTLRRHRPGLPVVFMTGYASLSIVDSPLTTDPVIMKPFRVSDVIDALKSVGMGTVPEQTLWGK